MLRLILVVLIIFFITADGYAEETRVTLSDAENRVLKNSPLIQKSKEGIGEATARIDALDWDYGFYLRSNYRYNVGNTLATPEFPFDFRYRGDVDIEWELLRGLFGNTGGLFGNVGARKSLEIMKGARQYEMKQTIADELAVVRIFFFNALKQRSLKDGNKNALALKEQILREVEGLYEKKEILFSELMKARQEAEKLRSSERQYQRDYDKLVKAIAFRTGMSGDLTLSPPEGIPVPLSVEQLKEKLSSNYFLKSLTLKQQSVEAEPAVSTLFELSLFGGYTFQETVNRGFQNGFHAGIRFSVPLTLLQKAKAARNEIEHRAKGISSEYKEAQQDMNKQVDELYFEYLTDMDLMKLEEQNLRVIAEDIRLMKAYLENPTQTFKFSKFDLLNKMAEKAVSEAQIEAKRYDLWADYYKLYKFMEEVQ